MSRSKQNSLSFHCLVFDFASNACNDDDIAIIATKLSRELVIYAVMIHQLQREPGDRLRAAEPGSRYDWCIIIA